MTFKEFIYKTEGRLIRYACPFISDELYLKLAFKHRTGYPLNLENPQTFNEKLQWLKLNDRRVEYQKMVDKATAKEYVAEIVGEKYIIPTIGLWDSVDEIDWDSLPDQFVIKCTGDSGGVVVCKDKSRLDIEAAKAKLKKGWGRNYCKYNKEYPYENIRPRIIAEEYLEDESGYELKDYKIFCFNGEPKLLFVASDRQLKGEETKFDFFDMGWHHLPFTNGHPNSSHPIQKPKNFDEMIDVARKLSVDIPQVRIDLYNCNGKIYFGEITFFHWSGMTPFDPIEWDYKLGNMITLPPK